MPEQDEIGAIEAAGAPAIQALLQQLNLSELFVKVCLYSQVIAIFIFCCF